MTFDIRDAHVYTGLLMCGLGVGSSVGWGYGLALVGAALFWLAMRRPPSAS